jgi:hypothetical protein
LGYSKVMVTGILVSEEEYLHTSYRPDCEFDDGVLIERNVGTLEHGKLQAALGAYFFRRRKAWNLLVATEVRTRAGREVSDPRSVHSPGSRANRP